MSETTPDQERTEKLRKQIEERNEQQNALCKAIAAVEAREHIAMDKHSRFFCAFDGKDFDVPKELLPMALALAEACAMHWERKGQGKSPQATPEDVARAVVQSLNDKDVCTIEANSLCSGDIVSCHEDTGKEETIKSIEIDHDAGTIRAEFKNALPIIYDNHDSVTICVKPPPGMVDVDVSLRVPEDTAKALREGKIGGFSMGSRIPPEPQLFERRVGDLLPGDIIACHPAVGRKATVRAIDTDKQESGTLRIVFDDAPDMELPINDAVFSMPRRFEGMQESVDQMLRHQQQLNEAAAARLDGEAGVPIEEAPLDYGTVQRLGKEEAAKDFYTKGVAGLEPGDRILCHEDTGDEATVKKVRLSQIDGTATVEFEDAPTCVYVLGDEVSVLVAKEGQRGKPLPKTVNAETTLTVKVKDLKPGDVLTCFGDHEVRLVQDSAMNYHCDVSLACDKSCTVTSWTFPDILEVTIRRKESGDA